MHTRQDDPWSRAAAGYPWSGPLRDQVIFLLGYAILAPSGHNTQPWLFKLKGAGVEVRADRQRALPVVDPQDRELAISCGAAVGTLEVAARRFGLDVTVNVATEGRDPDLLAQVEVAKGGPASEGEIALFDAILHRRTTRSAFAMEPLSSDLLRSCRDEAAALGVAFDAIVDENGKRAVAELVAEGDRLQFEDPRFRRELALWVRSRRLGSKDGMSGASFGMPDVLSPVGRLVIRTFDMGDGVAAADENKILSATPALGLLSSPTDEEADWFATGRALSRVLLSLTASGLTASYLNQPIETDGLRPKLRDLASCSGNPQILLRMGRAGEMPEPTARRDLEDVIVGDPA